MKIKKVPNYWWDFDVNNNSILIESDHPKYPLIKKIPYDDFADQAILLAEKLISELASGRTSLKSVLED